MTPTRPTSRTLYDKHIDSHTVCTLDDQGHVLLYIDRQVINEYTSPQAFSGLREAGRDVWRPETALAVVDHVNPTAPQRVAAMADPGGALQVSYLADNCEKFGIELFDVLDKRQGIEHVIAPEQGFILPGMVIAAGDSHTTTYGALGAFGFGIGTSEIEHLLASQTLVYKRLKTLRVTVDGGLSSGLTSKDVIMALIGKIGASGATGYAIEFTGSTIAALSVEARMTICNMAVEAGARGAFMAPDDKVFAYLKDKPRAPKGELWERAVARWKHLHSDPDAVFDREIHLDARDLQPMVTWGTSPDQATAINGSVPDPEAIADPILRQDMRRALTYMGLEAGMPLSDIVISHAFIGSCTNARIEDLRDAAVVHGTSQLGLAAHACASDVVLQGTSPQDLDGNVATQAGVERAVDGAHAARADQAQQLVAPLRAAHDLGGLCAGLAPGDAAGQRGGPAPGTEGPLERFAAGG